MNTSSTIIESLMAAGYHPVYVWEAAPNEADEGHMHPFEVYIAVIEGSIEIEVEEVKIGLKAEDTLTIPAYALHKAVAGPTGCTYVIAERHK